MAECSSRHRPVECPLCGYLSPTLSLYVSHLRLVHSKDKTFRVICGIDECTEVFGAFAALNSHIYRHHRVALGLESAPVVDTGNHAEADDPDPVFVPEDEPDFMNPFHNDCFATTVDALLCSSSTPMKSIDVSAAKFLLHMKEGRQVSQVAISDIIAGCNSLCNQALREFQTKLKSDCVNAGIDCSHLPGLADSVNIDLFESVKSNYLFEKFCMEHFGCLEPQEVALGDPFYENQFSGAKRRKVLRQDSFFHISLLDTLTNLLRVDEILSEVLNPHVSRNNTLHDYCDGEYFKTHPLFGSDPQALQIIAYYDELEVVNPIGSYVKKHKLGCLSFSLGNIRPLYRSSLKAHYLVSVAKHEDIVRYGIDEILRPFVEELKVLYCDGISVSINGESSTLYGGLLAFLADNLAAHLIGGFKESMSFSLRICRTCMITPDLMQQNRHFIESNCVLRTPEKHFEQCSKLDGPLSGHYSTTYGINRLSVLEEVPGFSVVTALLHDTMHDLYEGIVPMEVKLLLDHCICGCKYFTKQELNDRLQSFDFPENKPSAIDTRQSASQMITLLRFLPLIIGDKIPSDDEYWHNFLLLIKICGLAMSPVFTHDNAAYLSLLVEEKLELFTKLFPATRLIPKQHYMVHYAQQIVNFGPLVQAWCMRQEAKLSFIKRVSRKSNFKNVCKTAAKKHQFWLCYKLTSEFNLFVPQLECSPKIVMSRLIDEPIYVQDKILQIIPGISMEHTLKHPKWVKILSSTFTLGVFVCIEYDLLEPKFGKVFDIIVFEGRVLVCVDEYIGSYFCAHYNGFVIKQTACQIAVDISSLVDHRPLHARHSFDKNDTDYYICLPYYM